MFEGVLILQSLRVGTRLPVPNLTVTKLSHVEVSGATAGQPKVWSMIEFSGPEQDAASFADALANALDPTGAWYADFAIGSEHVVIFPGKVFRYPAGDANGRIEAERYGRSLNIPQAQLDWPQ